MTAIAAGATSAATPPMSGRFLGLRPLLRKDGTNGSAAAGPGSSPS